MIGMPRPLRLLPLAALAGWIFACNVVPEPSGETKSKSPPPPAEAAPAPAPAAVIKARAKPSSRIGGALVRSAFEDALYLADEDHGVLRQILLPASESGIAHIGLPGSPAQVLALTDRVLVTIRDPGLLLVFKPGEDGALKEAARVSLPDDAWGIAVSPDEKTALVTSAWSHKVSGVDVDRAAVRFTVDVPREPRGVVIQNDGASAYVTHLMGSTVTKITGLGGDAPTVSSVALPADPLRTAYGDKTSASLGYAAVLSPDGGLLFAARHALGALGPEAWFGSSTVDVLSTRDDKPIAPRRAPPALGTPSNSSASMFTGGSRLRDVAGTLPTTAMNAFTQPRAMVYRASTSTLLVASEGNDALIELDALSVAPGLQRLRTYMLDHERDPELGVAGKCGAPSGIALSPDELKAWVFCRSTYHIAEVPLDPHTGDQARRDEAVRFTRVAKDTLSEGAALGRRLFYNANDSAMSGGLGCAGCHPDGRDDGFLWHELKRTPTDSHAIFVATGAVLEVPRKETEPLPKGFARQTPMLAGRVAAKGPYGWHAESEDLESRLVAGFDLHRWSGGGWRGKKVLMRRASPLAQFLREGLVPPPRPKRDLTPQEERGQALFLAASTQCSTCHVPATGYTDGTATPLAAFPAPQGYDEDPNPAFKVPSLLFVGGTPPYYHDARVSTLEDLVVLNNDRMGKTNHLSREDREALVAFLKTL
jgi:DNA-binding beta-propeller fold protein YncE/mono/diheme cytochrome c family protein